MNAAAPTTVLAAPPQPTTPAQHAARRTAEEFESVFLGQFAQTLFAGVKSDGPFGGGPAEDIFKSLLANEYGKSMARSGGIGIADTVYREILKSQEID